MQRYEYKLRKGILRDNSDMAFSAKTGSQGKETSQIYTKAETEP